MSKVIPDLRDKGVQMYAVGVGPNVRNDELDVMASKPDNVYRVPYSQLPQYGGQLYQALRAYPRTPGNTATHVTDCNVLYLSGFIMARL